MKTIGKDPIMEMANPTNGFLKLDVIISLCIILFLLYMYIISELDILLLLIMISILLYIIATGFYQDFYNMPYCIKFYNDGILLSFSLRRDRFIQWQEIRSSTHKDRDISTFFGRLTNGGGIFLHNSIPPIILTPKIVCEIRSQYLKRVGRPMEKRRGSD
jgi:hypothetical protein